MKHTWLLLMAGCLLSISQLSGQNYEEFKKQREKEQQQYSQQEDKFKANREAEYQAFRKAYEAEFERYKKNYLAYLNGEMDVLDLMASDDGLTIKSLPKNKQPKGVSSTIADEQSKLRNEIKYITRTTPDELLKDISKSKDKVQQVKDGASQLKAWNEAMEKDGTPIQTLSPTVPTVATPKPEVKPEPKKEPKAEPQKEEKPAEKPVAEPETKPEAKPEAKPETDTEIPQGKPTQYTRLSSKFGPRIHPITKKQSTHKGVDLAAPKMTPIYATANGVIAFSGTQGGYGNFIKINHENGYKTAYAHMAKLVAKKGSHVKKGDLIGYVGSTGQSTGNHLHYEIYYKDKLVDPEKTL